MNAEEGEDEQTPADTKPTRWPECRCNGLAYGGCRCEDDGSTWNNYAEREDHSTGGAPRVVNHESNRGG